MSITDRTRKALWAKSGNRCAICRLELIQEVEDNADKLIVGEECHIVSSTKLGPRGNVDYCGDYDSYDNLILLCRNDHKRVDELVETFTIDRLKLFKLNHETWVRTTLEKDIIAFTNDKYNLKYLPRITAGKQIVDIVHGSHACEYSHDDLKTDVEATTIGGLFDELRDYGDIQSELGFTELANWGLHLNQEIESLSQFGFILFGMKRRHRFIVDNGVCDIATIVAVRCDNPSIVGDFLLARFPKKATLSF